MKRDFQIQNLEDLKNFTHQLKPLLKERAILLLQGNLGVGKTKTVEFLLRELNFNQTSSPTFALHQQYSVAELSVDHFDLYRVESTAELESIGFWDVFSKASGWVIVEWSERLNPTELPPGWPVFKLYITLENGVRKFSLTQLQSGLLGEQ